MKQVNFKFKSYDKHFHREYFGFKPNTVRKIDLEDDRFLDLICYAHQGWNEKLHIIITNSETGKEFIREIQDIDIHKDLMIISWKHNPSKIKPLNKEKTLPDKTKDALVEAQKE